MSEAFTSAAIGKFTNPVVDLFNQKVYETPKLPGGKIYTYLSNSFVKPHLVIPVFRPQNHPSSPAANATIYSPKDKFNPTDEELGLTEDEIQFASQEFTAQSNVRVACSILFKSMKFFLGKETNPEGWKSYGVTIANNGDEVKMTDLFDHTETIFDKSQFGNVTGSQSTQCHNVPTIVAKCLIPYRVARSVGAEVSAYYSHLETKLTALYTNVPYTSISMGGVSLPHWSENKTYCQLAAAYDQFMIHFETHPYSSLRACTLIANLKDCVLLSSVASAAHSLTLSINQFFEYCFLRDIGTGILHISEYSSKEELDIKDSYFAYFSEYKLLPRSPYSASAGADLHVFCHIIGSLQSSVRSINARLIDVHSLTKLFCNAIYVTYLLRKGSGFNRGYFSNVQAALDFEAALAKQHLIHTQIKKPLKDITPELVLAELNGCEGLVPDHIRAYFNSEKPALTKSRPGTVGRYVMEQLGFQPAASGLGVV